MLAVILLIRLSVGRPVFVVEKRIGHRGKTFACLRFRTALSHAFVEEALRGSSLDKVPLLFSVLLGDMSLVGPRPIMAHEAQWHHATAPELFMARPGLTGMWRHARAKDRRARARSVALDRYYVRHWSMRLDCALLIKAVAASSHAEAV
jgi:exopolysaccharide production protein ExoY